MLIFSVSDGADVMITIEEYRVKIGCVGAMMNCMHRRNMKRSRMCSEVFKNKTLLESICEILHNLGHVDTSKYVVFLCSILVLIICVEKGRCLSTSVYSKNALNYTKLCNNTTVDTCNFYELVKLSNVKSYCVPCEYLPGCVAFIHRLLLIAGVESNPGPFDWEVVHKSMVQAKTFSELSAICLKLEIPDLPMRFIGDKYLSHYRCDRSAQHLIPSDSPVDSTVSFPVRTSGIGNCFPAALSRIVFGNEDHQLEMRVRLVYEGVSNIDVYLSNSYLGRGIESRLTEDIGERYCSYSRYFVHNVEYTPARIRSVYQQEILSVRRNFEYCGIWQFHQAANVLDRRIFSIYPHTVITSIRDDLHRMIYPKSPMHVQEPCCIMWTTATELSYEFNHFVPVVRYVYEVFFDR